MKYLTYNELVEAYSIKPFENLGTWMAKIAAAVVQMSQEDYWLVTYDDDTDDEIKKRWTRRVAQIDGYCSMIGPTVEARLEAAAAPKAAGSKIKTKFNDAPDTVGDYSDDQHTSTITTAESSGELSSMEQDSLGKIYGIMMGIADDLMRKFSIRSEYL